MSVRHVSRLLLGLMFLYLPLVGSAADESASKGEVQSAIVSLARQIQAKRVHSVEIMYIPKYIVYNVNVSPERLKNQYRYKLTIKQFEDSRQAPLLEAALKRTLVQPTERSADLRWGIILNLVGGETRQIYVDGFGHLGEIDHKPVIFKGDLHEWLGQFSASMK